MLTRTSPSASWSMDDGKRVASGCRASSDASALDLLLNVRANAGRPRSSRSAAASEGTRLLLHFRLASYA
jgi:hypothetical protein